MRLTKVGWAAVILGGLWAFSGVGFLIAAVVRNPPESLMGLLGGFVVVLLFTLPGVGSSALVAWSSLPGVRTETIKKASIGGLLFSFLSVFLVGATIIAGGYLFAPLALASVALAVTNVIFGKSPKAPAHQS